MLFFFFKQKTAYDMRISDWSSDMCSADLQERLLTDIQHLFAQNPLGPAVWPVDETAFASEVARFSAGFPSAPDPAAAMRWVRGAEGVVDIGHAGDGFAFDCAGPRFSALLKRSEEHTSELQSLMRISYAVL